MEIITKEDLLIKIKVLTAENTLLKKNNIDLIKSNLNRLERIETLEQRNKITDRQDMIRFVDEYMKVCSKNKKLKSALKLRNWIIKDLEKQLSVSASGANHEMQRVIPD